MDKDAKPLSRKEFLKTSAAGILGICFSSISVKDSNSAGQKKNEERPGLAELGRTGIKVTPLGFGASRTMEQSLVMAALEAGLNFLDTGRSYFRGQNEMMIGRATAGLRKEVVIQSKLDLGLTSQQLNSPAEIKRAVAEMEASLQASLRALQTDYLDIMLIHGAVSPEVIFQEEVRRFFEDAKRKGTIKAHGFSCHTNQVELLRAANKKLFYDVVMLPYNHQGAYVHANTGRPGKWDQVALEEEMDKARQNGLGLIAMKTCSGGQLAAGPGAEPTFEEALRWILRRSKVHTMAVAMANYNQLKEDLQALQ
ncbi:MAG TPA: hypothetical protein DCW97_00830 [Acidobacteria bacterium]|nr:hypothetical protein [Acidobacteriota bacterium]